MQENRTRIKMAWSMEKLGAKHLDNKKLGKEMMVQLVPLII
jgi:hypothetical protein